MPVGTDCGPPSPPPLVFYLHGYHSSAQASKAQLLQHYLDRCHPAVEYRRPQLPDRPSLALAVLENWLLPPLAAGRPVGLVGASLGGYYAAVLAARLPVRAVLVNPVVDAYSRLLTRLGSGRNPYTGCHYLLDSTDLAALSECRPRPIPGRLRVLLQTGDEVLDYREAADFYAACHPVIETGGDHRFQNFERHLPAIAKFLQWPAD